MNATPRRSIATKHEAQFAAEYLVDLNGTQALLRVRPGITTASAAVQASRLLRRPRVVNLIGQLQAERAKRTEVRADEVLLRLWQIATADPRELIGIRVTPCPQCYADAKSPVPDKPNRGCQNCWGDGAPKVVIAATGALSPAAAMLYAGARPTRWGLQVLLNGQLQALELIGQHLGMWGTQSALKPAKDPSDPIQTLINELAARHSPSDTPTEEPNDVRATRRWRAA